MNRGCCCSCYISVLAMLQLQLLLLCCSLIQLVLCNTHGFCFCFFLLATRYVRLSGGGVANPLSARVWRNTVRVELSFVHATQFATHAACCRRSLCRSPLPLACLPCVLPIEMSGERELIVLAKAEGERGE